MLIKWDLENLFDICKKIGLFQQELSKQSWLWRKWLWSKNVNVTYNTLSVSFSKMKLDWLEAQAGSEIIKPVDNN